MRGPDPLDHAWWLASRSAGIAALVAISLSVILGLLMANGLPRRPGATRLLLSMHEAAALSGLIALAVHGVTLLGDPFLHPTVRDILVPLSISFKPVWVALGIAGGWMAAVLGLTYYARKRIGARLWRRVHRATILAWALSVAPTLGSGPDAREPWLQGAMLLTAVPIVFLFLRRVVPGDPKREAAARARLADAGV